MLLNLHRHTPHISIHAPSRERLSDSHRAAEYRRISIHAPSRERRYYYSVFIIASYFNPRSLAGATYRVRLYTHCRYISIHAPSRERLKHNIRRLSCKNFNPRSLAGATCRSHRQTSLQEFQSTLPRGSDS